MKLLYVFALEKASFSFVNAVWFFRIKLSKPKVARSSLHRVISIHRFDDCNVQAIALLALGMLPDVAEKATTDGELTHGHANVQVLVAEESYLLVCEQLLPVVGVGAAKFR